MGAGCQAGWVVLLGVLLSACGGEDGDEAAGGGSGQVAPPWDTYCVATFTEDAAVQDEFDEPLFTARAGERYLMADYGEFFGEDTADLLFLTSSGPESFRLTAPAGSQDFPFTTDCTFDGGVPYYAVFADVSVHATAALDNVLCEPSAGTALPLDTSSGAGYFAESFNFSGPSTYSVSLNAFSAQCGGQEDGFISVPEIKIHGTTTWLVPITTIIGPD